MFWIIFGVSLFMLLLGSIIFRKLNKKSTPEKSSERIKKLVSYTAIVFIMLFSIEFIPWLLYLISTLLIFIAIMEIVRVSRQADKNPWPVLLLAGLVFYFFAGFIRNSNPEIILFVYFIVINFDGFSQVIGESIGRRKLVPKISPGKTREGLAGGIFVALILGMLMLPFFKIYNTWYELLVFILIIIASSVAGDLLASVYKRYTGVKDYSNLIPGHGGILDRFDSFFMAGAIIEALHMIMKNYAGKY